MLKCVRQSWVDGTTDGKAKHTVYLCSGEFKHLRAGKDAGLVANGTMVVQCKVTWVTIVSYWKVRSFCTHGKCLRANMQCCTREPLRLSVELYRATCVCSWWSKSWNICAYLRVKNRFGYRYGNSVGSKCFSNRQCLIPIRICEIAIAVRYLSQWSSESRRLGVI